MTQAINQKVLSKSGRSLVKHGYWKNKHSEGVWDNGKQVGKHIYFGEEGSIAYIILYTNNGDGNRILWIDYKDSWCRGDKNGNVFWVDVFNLKSKGNECIAYDRQYSDDEFLEWFVAYKNLALVEEVLDANEDILMGCISVH